MDAGQAHAIRSANSMELFADGGKTFRLGKLKAWQAACAKEGRTIPPSEFKARTRTNQPEEKA